MEADALGAIPTRPAESDQTDTQKHQAARRAQQMPQCGTELRQPLALFDNGRQTHSGGRGRRCGAAQSVEERC
jgi:hypothetical protein